MTQRLNQLDEERLFTLLKEARANLDEFKNRQFTSGSSGVLGYRSQTTNQWDYNATVSTGSPSSFLDTTYTLNFTSDGTQNYPMINPAMDIFAGSPIEANRLKPNIAWSDGTNTAMLSGYFFLATDRLSVGYPALSSINQLQWFTVISVAGSVALFIKAYAVGSCRGTVTLTRTF